jgi:hypothetical protein
MYVSVSDGYHLSLSLCMCLSEVRTGFFISQKTALFIVTAVKTSNLTCITGDLKGAAVGYKPKGSGFSYR